MWFSTKSKITKHRATSKLFQSSGFKYFIVWMKVVSGIQLDYPANGAEAKLKKFLVFFTFWAFLINCFANGWYAHYEITAIVTENGAYAQKMGLSKVKLFNLFVDCITFLVFSVGIHLTFLTAFYSRKWENLYNCLATVERQMRLTDDFYISLRKLVLIGFFKTASVCNIIPIYYIISKY